MGRERHERVPEHVGLLEHAVHERQHVGVAAEILAQFHVARAHRVGAHDALVLLVHAHVGAAEAVDGLLRVAHRAQMREARAGQTRDHVDLHLARVLELVHHHELEAPLVAPRDVGMPFKGLERAREQIVVVERASGALRLLVAGMHVGGEGGEGVRERVREPERDLANRAVVGRLKRLDRGLHRRREVPADARAARIDRFRERAQPAVRVAPSFARPFGQKRRERLRAVGRLGAARSAVALPPAPASASATSS